MDKEEKEIRLKECCQQWPQIVCLSCIAYCASFECNLLRGSFIL